MTWVDRIVTLDEGRARRVALLAFAAGILMAPDRTQATEIRPCASARLRMCTSLTLVGHEGIRVDTLPAQHITRVVGIGPRDKDGHIYSVSTAYAAFVPDELRSWRLSFLGGKMVGGTFQVATNGPDSIAVTTVNGPLDGVRVGDMLMIESVVVRDIPVRR